MSTLLITMLGGAGPDEERTGHPSVRYRLPGGERIVETSNLGIELARALRCDKLVIAGTTTAYFDRLVDLLPAEDAQAPVQETAPATDDAAEEGDAAGSEDDAADATSEADEPTEASGSDETSDDADAASPPTDESPSSDATDEAPADAGGAAPAAEDAPTTEDAGADASAETADAGSSEGTEDADSPAAAEAPESGTDATATDDATAADEPAEASADDATPPPTKAPRPPKKAHVPDTRPLAERLLAQAKSARADRDALAALSERLSAALGIAEVSCVLISDPTQPRSVMSSIRTLADAPAAGDEVSIDVTYGPRAFTTLGVLALQFLSRFRPDIDVGSVYLGHPENRDRSGAAPVITMDGAFEFMTWMRTFDGLFEGRAPSDIQEIMNQDRRLQRLSGPYVRYQRGVRFGALSEVIEGSRLLDERLKRMSRLPYAHPFRLFSQVMRQTISPFVGEMELSARQYLLAVQAYRNGLLPQAALHLRESLVSACIEAYGRNPARAWIEVPQSGGAQQVRPREIAGFILSTPAAQELAPDLAVIWPLLATARNRYVNASPTTVPAAQLKDEDHEIQRIIDLTLPILDRALLAGINEKLDFNDAAKEAIDLRVVRPREGRREARAVAAVAEVTERKAAVVAEAEGASGARAPGAVMAPDRIGATETDAGAVAGAADAKVVAETATEAVAVVPPGTARARPARTKRRRPRPASRRSAGLGT